MKWACCKQKGCIARYALRRIQKPQDNIIVLETSRDLLGEPLHVSWDTQIEWEPEADEHHLPVSTTQTCSRQGACLSSFESLLSCETTCPYPYPFVPFADTP